MFNNACKYAIRAVLCLSLHSDKENKLGARFIAEELEVPQPFLAQLLRQLTSARVISSTKGPGGGFYLTAENRRRTLWDVITCIDKDYPSNECMLGLARCSSTNPCPVHHIAVPFREKFFALFKEKTLDSLAEEIRNNGTVISLKGLLVQG